MKTIYTTEDKYNHKFQLIELDARDAGTIMLALQEYAFNNERAGYKGISADARELYKQASIIFHDLNKSEMCKKCNRELRVCKLLGHKE